MSDGKSPDSQGNGLGTKSAACCSQSFPRASAGHQRACVPASTVPTLLPQTYQTCVSLQTRLRTPPHAEAQCTHMRAKAQRMYMRAKAAAMYSPAMCSPALRVGQRAGMELTCRGPKSVWMRPAGRNLVNQAPPPGDEDSSGLDFQPWGGSYHGLSSPPATPQRSSGWRVSCSAWRAPGQDRQARCTRSERGGDSTDSVPDSVPLSLAACVLLQEELEVLYGRLPAGMGVCTARLLVHSGPQRSAV